MNLDTSIFCAASPEAQALPEDEFWDRLFNIGWGPDPEPDISDLGWPDEPGLADLTTPCSLCGAVGACGYDLSGRPLIHAEELCDGD